MGAGDGRAALAEARANPETFVIAVDAVAQAMDEASRRAATKPDRGGAPNAMFICAAAETLPGPLAGIATGIVLNYPWGSLLRAVALPDPAVLAKIAATGGTDAEVSAFINVYPLRNAAHAERLGLANAALLHDHDALRRAYGAAGLMDLSVRSATLEEQPVTSWGRRLAASQREVLRLEARVRPVG